jgi:hypothetical protein
VRQDLLRECGKKLDATQTERLDELLKFRIRGFIEQADFRRRLEEPMETGGVGVDPDTARNASWYLEKLIGQGMYL